ncbi:hypothetical protein C1E24_12415 [Pseudoalteromonas phenolica]|uniref:Uncharacterized protein n=1 Tax=Pseudoalteromonas phenolica TaxID=161398 RepID=A0A5R9Q0I0_9GAMM|nr:hypothetical protein [Pseudoalteromonas phenolica]TLX46663.1 hypothetical protein C1E24_12415 [Pseudoalteromonas phenolica]
MFTMNFSCVNIGTRNIARFVGIYSGILGENKLLGIQMKRWCVFLIVVSSSALSVELDALEITQKILESSNPKDVAAQYFHNQELLNAIENLGSLEGSKCFLNHDSKVFDTVTCQIIPIGQKSGLVVEFYYFLDGVNWVGTNFSFVQQLPKDICINNIAVIKGIGNGLSFNKIKC